MTAAVEIAMNDLAASLPGKPLLVVGYSNGGALAVHYTTASLSDPQLPVPDGLILFSAEIGITPAARLSRVQAWMAERLGLKKLAWNSILPEYDPYKYTSFPTNAGIQAYRATKFIQSQLSDLEASGLIAKMPPILAFQSAADSTVEAPVLVSDLFDRLKGREHELVIFDANRMYDAEGLLVSIPNLEVLISGNPRSYRVSIVTNTGPTSFAVEVRERAAGETKLTKMDIGISWPPEVYSLAHIELPFAPDDPVYGAVDPPSGAADALQFGKLAMHGETKFSALPVSSLMRQHWNPFYPLVKQRVSAFINKHGKNAD